MTTSNTLGPNNRFKIWVHIRCSKGQLIMILQLKRKCVPDVPVLWKDRLEGVEGVNKMIETRSTEVQGKDKTKEPWASSKEIENKRCKGNKK